MMKKLILLSLCALSMSAFCVNKKLKSEDIALANLKQMYTKETKDKKFLKSLRSKTLSLGPRSVPVLIEVMKGKVYPDKNRWVATFMLGRIMGKKSSGFVRKFLNHPNWVLRMASMKTLLAVGERTLPFQKLLKDKSFLVRTQTLEAIKKLKINSQAKFVWEMLYDKRNYKGKLENSTLIKDIIETIGVLKFKEAQKPLLSMMSKKKYKGLYKEIDSSLKSITGKESPEGNDRVKQIFWNRYLVSQKVI